MISRVFIIGTVEEVNKFSFIISYEHTEITAKGWAKIAYKTEIIGVLTQEDIGLKYAIESTLKGNKILMTEKHKLPTRKGE